MEYDLFAENAGQDEGIASAFAFISRPGYAEVRFEGEKILSFVQEHLILRQFVMGEARLRPGGAMEIVCFMPSCFFGPKLLRAAVKQTNIGEAFIELTITPEKVDGDLREFVEEKRVVLIEYLPASTRFRYTITANLQIKQDVRGGEGLYITGMPQWGDDDYAVVEFDDPLLSGGVGPQVPMTQDWTGLPEPILGEHNFTTLWEKRFLAVTLDTKERGLRRLTFNRVVNGVQRFFNRYILVTKPGTPYFYHKTDGTALKMTPQFGFPCGHHICEWGFDMHFYAMLPKAGADLPFKKGQRVVLGYTLEDVEESEIPAAYANATEAEIEADERPLCDLPIYEEPACGFTASAMDHPDAYCWRLTGQGAWNRTGGKEPKTGALEIHHGAEGGESTWLFNYFGPSYAANPIPPFSRHRLAAWVKADELDKVTLTFTLDAHQGPAMYSPRVPVVSIATAEQIVTRDGAWALIEFESQPSGTYTLAGRIAFTYTGKGSASMSGLEVERL
ncbi:MAG: hypothetical protein BWY76_00785 [bacterium ADurb.Bin429]|nr:MAG: hypothetical protein BWY76_00785 [bacterium ADurb.Bin429]